MRSTIIVRLRHVVLPTVMFVVGLLVMLPLHVAAQDAGSGVWATTQDYVSLRTGPGTNFERIAVIDPGVTLPAVGRSAALDWVQVEYAGQRGWISSRFLVYWGDLVSLPVDGVNPAPFVRRALVSGVTTRETPLYERDIIPGTHVAVLPEGTPVEVTARLADATYQIYYDGGLYWVSAYNIRITDGAEYLLFNTTYLYAYGRLNTQLGNDISRSFDRLDSIEAIWRRLDAGESVSCQRIPAYIDREASDVDVDAESIFAPLVEALDSGNDDINAAIARFEDACGRTDDDFFLTQQDVNAALDELDSARQHLNVARSLLTSVQRRDPLLGDRR